MKKFKTALPDLITVACFTSTVFSQTTRWSEEKANEWYARQPWLVGSNYVPKSAINELEMWQEASFDPTQIDKELKLGQGGGGGGGGGGEEGGG